MGESSPERREKLFGSSEPSPAKEVLKPSVSETLGVLEVATAKAKPSEPGPREGADSGAVLWLGRLRPTGAEGILASWAEQTGGAGEVERSGAKTPVYGPDLPEGYLACLGR